jgi:hypothetical protein
VRDLAAVGFDTAELHDIERNNAVRLMPRLGQNS